MKIAIEAQRIFRPDKHGMDFVALETIRELQKRNDGNEYYIIVAPGKDHCLEESANLSIVEVACPTYPLWEQIALPLAVKRLGADLLHCTSNTAPLCCPIPLVLTLHDIIYLEPRQQRSPSLYQEMGRHYRHLTVPRILKKCRKIITVSHFERNRIREALNIPADRITTIYNGYSRHFRPMDDIDMQIVNRYIPQKDFLFFLGNTDPKKNTARVLKAYSLYLEKSSVRRPLLIADLNETYIDRLLQQEKHQQPPETTPILSRLYPQRRPRHAVQCSIRFPLPLAAREFRHPSGGSHGLRHSRHYGKHLFHARSGRSGHTCRRPLSAGRNSRCSAASRK